MQHGSYGLIEPPHDPRRLTPIRKTLKCDSGHLNGLRNIVLQCAMDNVDYKAKVTCACCLRVLEMHRFNQDHLRGEIQASLDAEGNRVVTTGAQDAVGAQVEAEQDGSEEKPENSDLKQEDDEIPLEEQADPFLYARKHAPMISLLPPGFAGKTFPYRCNACRSRRQKGQKVEK